MNEQVNTEALSNSELAGIIARAGDGRRSKYRLAMVVLAALPD